jgi:hypothetical protein
MSDPGFPPFRSAQPKGTRVSPQASPPTEEQLQKILQNEDDRPVQVNSDGSLSETATVQHITVCAKCGSREVREAVLIGDEVYVKL